MAFKDRLDKYLNTTRTVIKWLHVFKYGVAAVLLWKSLDWLSAYLKSEFTLGGITYYHTFFRRLLADPSLKTAKLLFHIYVNVGLAVVWMAAFTRIINMLKFTVLKKAKNEINFQKMMADDNELPPWPYERENFEVVLAEIQDQDGSRVPNEKKPNKRPQWLTLSEKALYTGIFVTGGIGSGKTASVGLPVLDQIIGHHREIPVTEKTINEKTGKEIEQETMKRFVWSGVVTDEKGDFCTETLKICKAHGRENDFIRIAPEGYWLWNPIYNPGLATWSVGFTLGKILDRYNKGATGSDPFWKNAPKDLILEYLTLMDYAVGYYSIGDFLRILIDENEQQIYHDIAVEALKDNPRDMEEMELCWNRIEQRNKEMSAQLKSSLQSCAKAGLNLFEYPEIRKTFSPSAKDYFTGPCCPWPRRKPESVEEIHQFDIEHELGLKLPKPNVFTGFDVNLENGIIVGLDMPKTNFKDSAVFVQIALKMMWQETIFRRDTRDESGRLYLEPRFGKEVGYCPSFIVADECQASVDPDDQSFMAQCRSKRAACVWLTQSHTSIIAAMGQGQKEAADGFFQNTMTHIYLRQNDITSMEIIEKEVGLRDIIKTTYSIAEGGQKTELDFSSGDIVNEGVGITETQTTAHEEKPLFEKETMKQLPNFTAIIVASTGESSLPATIGYTRPSYVFKMYPNLKKETCWHNWPLELRTRATLDNLPQSTKWSGWKLKDKIKETLSGLSGFTSDYRTYDEGELGREQRIRAEAKARKEQEEMEKAGKARGQASKNEASATPGAAAARDTEKEGANMTIDEPRKEKPEVLDATNIEKINDWESDFLQSVENEEKNIDKRIKIAAETADD